MSIWKLRGPLVIGAAVALFAAPAVRANSIITSLLSKVGLVYTYEVDLTTEENIDTTKGPQFGTIFDFGPMSGLSATGLLATNFTITTPFTSPHALLTNAPDSPTLQNIHFEANAPLFVSGPQLLGTITVTSTNPFGISTINGFFEGQATTKPPNPAIAGNIGQLPVPATVPEPTSIALLGTMMIGVAAGLRKRLTRKA